MQIGPVPAWLIPELMCYYMRYFNKGSKWVDMLVTLFAMSQIYKNWTIRWFDMLEYVLRNIRCLIEVSTYQKPTSETSYVTVN